MKWIFKKKKPDEPKGAQPPKEKVTDKDMRVNLDEQLKTPPGGALIRKQDTDEARKEMEKNAQEVIANLSTSQKQLVKAFAAFKKNGMTGVTKESIQGAPTVSEVLVLVDTARNNPGGARIMESQLLGRFSRGKDEKRVEAYQRMLADLNGKLNKVFHMSLEANPKKILKH